MGSKNEVTAPDKHDEAVRALYAGWCDSDENSPDLVELIAAALRAAEERGDAAGYARGVTEERAKLDAAYSERNQCVALLARMALRCGWPAGTLQHVGAEWDDDWRTIVAIDLPSGQVTWHFHDSEAHLLAGLPAYPAAWDGHDTAEKYRRVAVALHAVPPAAKQPAAAPVHIDSTCPACNAVLVVSVTRRPHGTEFPAGYSVGLAKSQPPPLGTCELSDEPHEEGEHAEEYGGAAGDTQPCRGWREVEPAAAQETREARLERALRERADVACGYECELQGMHTEACVAALATLAEKGCGK